MPVPRKKDGMLAVVGDTPPHELCWAKTRGDGSPGINVRDHCLNVGCVAEALLELLSPRLKQLIPRGAASLATLHDVGKVSPGFQAKSQLWLEQRCFVERARKENWSAESDHAKISQSTVQHLVGGSGLHWAAAVGAHHGKIKGERVLVHAPWEEERVRLAEELIREFGPLPVEAPTDAVLWFEGGLITVADWIGSDEQNFPQDARWEMPERRQQAQTALARLQWRAVAVRQGKGFTDLFPKIPQPNSLQIAALETVREPGVYIFEGPMGCGKTEAALAASYQLIASSKANGIYFALPTQVTSNRIHLRVQPFVDRISTDPALVRLAHGASWLIESEPPAQPGLTSPNDAEARDHVRAGRSWFASAKRALLMPFGVGTIDQALLGIVAAKHFFVRQFGLAGKVVILDEVHTYDLYTGTLLDALVSRLRELQCTVILLSATLTKERRHQLLGASAAQQLSSAYPLVSGMTSSLVERECGAPPAKTVLIRTISGAVPVQEVLQRALGGACVLWVRNTVDEAQETYRALHDASPGGWPSIALLHSRFPFFRREELENDWMERLGKDATKRPTGCVLVSTQVAEQSVDIDADLLITDLAPTDMLLQRLGRLWRHDRESRPSLQPEVWIQMPDCDDIFLHRASVRELRAALGRSARVYAPYVLLRSLQQWRSRAAITLPGEIREILEATYADAPAGEPAAWRELWQQLQREKERMARLALNATAIWQIPALPDEEGVQTRLSSYPVAQLLLAREVTRLGRRSVRVQLLNGDEVTASGRDWDFSVAKAIHRNLVRVPRWAVARALVDPPGWLSNHVSQSTAIGLLQSDGSIRWAGREEPTGLAYDADQGVVTNPEIIRNGEP
jgi:CRISPR-associated endonuclease/helicase Cas3